MKFNLFSIAALLFSCCHSFKETGTKPPSHESWDKLLKKYVTEQGLVDYKNFVNDTAELNNYLALLENNPPDENTWAKEDQIAYWINAYNASTVKLILMHYPVESINDIGPKVQIPLVNSPFDIKFIQIGKEKMDLNNIEHGQLRKKFNEPRIHFALNCASMSCPVLRREAYNADKLNEQLHDQAKTFINDTTRNKITADHVRISKVFSWFEGDFTKDSSLVDFLNRYSNVTIDQNAKIDYLDYDWSLNDAAENRAQ